MRVCPRCRKRVSRAGQQVLRRLLWGMPIYARLLDEYPRARIAEGEAEVADPAP